jgi:hypothetical protein
VNVDSEAHITSHFVGIEGSFLGVKVAGLCTGHNSLPSAYVKNGCRYISARWMEKQHLALWGSPCSTGRWNVMAHGDAWEGKWKGKRRLERVATILALYLGTWSIHGLPADPHSLTASSRLNWLPRRFKWTRPFLWKNKSGFCVCAITFQTCSTQRKARELISGPNLATVLSLTGHNPGLLLACSLDVTPRENIDI